MTKVTRTLSPSIIDSLSFSRTFSLEILHQAPPSRLHQVSSSSSSSLAVDVFIQPRCCRLHQASPSLSAVVSVKICRRLHQSLSHNRQQDIRESRLKPQSC
ncbi:hypothetical protein Bca4012_026551 [Brassica carinata]